MLNAEQARQRAQQAAALQRLVNEGAAKPLMAACENGETSARIDIDPVSVKAAGVLGRLYDVALMELLEKNNHAMVAQAVKRFLTLGFRVSSVPEAPADGSVGMYEAGMHRINHLVLDFSTAPAPSGKEAPATLTGIPTLPPAHHWRARAETFIVLKQYEAKVTAIIGAQAEQGATRCVINWRDIGAGAPQPAVLNRIADGLRKGGFQVDIADAGSGLRVQW